MCGDRATAEPPRTKLQDRLPKQGPSFTPRWILETELHAAAHRQAVLTPSSLGAGSRHKGQGVLAAGGRRRWGWRTRRQGAPEANTIPPPCSKGGAWTWALSPPPKRDRARRWVPTGWRAGAERHRREEATAVARGRGSVTFLCRRPSYKQDICFQLYDSRSSAECSETQDVQALGATPSQRSVTQIAAFANLPYPLSHCHVQHRPTSHIIPVL